LKEYKYISRWIIGSSRTRQDKVCKVSRKIAEHKAKNGEKGHYTKAKCGENKAKNGGKFV
jgi:hypothetical protein